VKLDLAARHDIIRDPVAQPPQRTADNASGLWGGKYRRSPDLHPAGLTALESCGAAASHSWPVTTADTHDNRTPRPMADAKTPGVYLLTIRLPRTVTLSLAGTDLRLKSGWYVYAGSAMNGLEGRLRRHLRTSQPRHWHVDGLLANGAVADIQLRPAAQRSEECTLAALVRDWAGACPIPGFGASDCRCGSHLAGFAQRPIGAATAPLALPALSDVYRELRARYVDRASRDRDPFRTLVSCILSLRTQDPVTDAAAARLFAHLRTPQQFAGARAERIASLIYPVGMYNEKSKRLIEIARQIIERFGGATPAGIDQLLTLPGVGRKTANLVRSFGFHLPAICVDTHVHRITNRWGLVRTVSPEETERELRRILPGEHWIETNAFLVQHGQQVCRPQRPDCSRCFLQPWCGYPLLQEEREVLSHVPDAPPHPSLKVVAPK